MQSIANVTGFTLINGVSVSVILHHQSFVLNISQWPRCLEDGKMALPHWLCPWRGDWPGVLSFTGSEHKLDRFSGWDPRDTFLKSWYENSDFPEGQAFLGHSIWLLANLSFHLPKVSVSWVGPQSQVGQCKPQCGSTAQGPRGSKDEWLYTSEAVAWEWGGQTSQRRPLMWAHLRLHLSQSYHDFPTSHFPGVIKL